MTTRPRVSTTSVPRRRRMLAATVTLAALGALAGTGIAAASPGSRSSSADPTPPSSCTWTPTPVNTPVAVIIDSTNVPGVSGAKYTPDRMNKLQEALHTYYNKVDFYSYTATSGAATGTLTKLTVTASGVAKVPGSGSTLAVSKLSGRVVVSYSTAVTEPTDDDNKLVAWVGSSSYSSSPSFTLTGSGNDTNPALATITSPSDGDVIPTVTPGATSASLNVTTPKDGTPSITLGGTTPNRWPSDGLPVQFSKAKITIGSGANLVNCTGVASPGSSPDPTATTDSMSGGGSDGGGSDSDIVLPATVTWKGMAGPQLLTVSQSSSTGTGGTTTIPLAVAAVDGSAPASGLDIDGAQKLQKSCPTTTTAPPTTSTAGGGSGNGGATQPATTSTVAAPPTSAKKSPTDSATTIGGATTQQWCDFFAKASAGGGGRAGGSDTTPGGGSTGKLLVGGLIGLVVGGVVGVGLMTLNRRRGGGAAPYGSPALAGGGSLSPVGPAGGAAMGAGFGAAGSAATHSNLGAHTGPPGVGAGVGTIPAGADTTYGGGAPAAGVAAVRSGNADSAEWTVAVPGGQTVRLDDFGARRIVPVAIPSGLVWASGRADCAVTSGWFEKRARKGEDAEPTIRLHASGRGLIGVYDGTGGAGAAVARTTSDGTELSGAWVAARLVRDVVEAWFVDAVTDGDRALETAGLAATLQRVLTDEAESLPTVRTAVRGKLHRVLPTTAACVAFDAGPGGHRVDTLWAGDSRGFLLTPDNGLQVLTRDDTREDDALELIRNDQPMENLIAADRPFRVNHRRFDVASPFVVVTATDGAFGYVRTPAHFEFLILEALQGANTIDDWSARLLAAFAEFAGDDVSFAIAAVGFPSFAALQDQFEARHGYLATEHWKPFVDNAGDADAIEKLRVDSWSVYKDLYSQRILAPDAPTTPETRPAGQ